MHILFDCLGLDLGVEAIVEGAHNFQKNHPLRATFVGKKEDIEKALEKFPVENSDIYPADEVILNTEEPTRALRKKKNSSLVRSLTMLKEGKGDAVLSAGSTGALLAGGLFIVGRKEGIKRACLPAPIPGPHGPICLVDAGANVDCSPEILESFAQMGQAYVENVFDKKDPKVYLLNIGSEPGKGNQQTKESFKLLEENKAVNFLGNLESRDLFSKEVDVLVADGFAGNILLKTLEGMAAYLFGLIKDQMTGGKAPSSGGGSLKALQKAFDYEEVGAVPLLGLEKLVFKAHGSSGTRAFEQALVQIEKAVDHQLIDKF